LNTYHVQEATDIPEKNSPSPEGALILIEDMYKQQATSQSLTDISIFTFLYFDLLIGKMGITVTVSSS
jgi:hypothetical protein